MDRRVTSPKGVTSPSWGTPPPCKQALKRKKSQERIVMKKASSFTLPGVVVGVSVARKRKKLK